MVLLSDAKRAVAKAKATAKEARKTYAEAAARVEVESDGSIDMKGLNTDGEGTGIPGGLDAIGSEAADLFLPDQTRTAADVAYMLTKLEYDYSRRRDQI